MKRSEKVKRAGTDQSLLLYLKEHGHGETQPQRDYDHAVTMCVSICLTLLCSDITRKAVVKKKKGAAVNVEHPNRFLSLSLSTSLCVSLSLHLRSTCPFPQAESDSVAFLVTAGKLLF